MKMGEKSFTRGNLARRAGIGAETIRFYENKGLLSSPERNESGYRIYGEADLLRVNFIKRSKDLGFTLEEIRELLKLQVAPGDSCDEVRTQAEQKIKEIEEKVRDLNRMKRTLNGFVYSCESRNPTGECPLIESLNRR